MTPRDAISYLSPNRKKRKNAEYIWTVYSNEAFSSFFFTKKCRRTKRDANAISRVSEPDGGRAFTYFFFSRGKKKKNTRTHKPPDSQSRANTVRTPSAGTVVVPCPDRNTVSHTALPCVHTVLTRYVAHHSDRKAASRTVVPFVTSPVQRAALYPDCKAASRQAFQFEQLNLTRHAYLHPDLKAART